MGEPVRVCIGVGSNIDPEMNVMRALECLDERIRITGTSTVYRTVPLGRSDQPPFLNCVWTASTCHDPSILKHSILSDVENDAGRIRTNDPWAPRTIDLDLILFGDSVIDDGALIVPDPDIYTRPFLALPLLELDPALELPDTGRSITEVAGGMQRTGMTPDHTMTEKLRRYIHDERGKGQKSGA